jgi:hypothetical protein
MDPSTLPNKVLSDLKSGDESVLRCKIEGVVSDNAAVKVSIGIAILLHHDITLSNIFTRPICLVKYKLWIDPIDWEDVLYIDGRGCNSCLLA